MTAGKVCLVDEVEARIEVALAESPKTDECDMVILADEVLRDRDPSYVLPPEILPFEGIADEIVELGEDLREVRAIAIYATARLYGFGPSVPVDEAALDRLADRINERAPARAAARRYLDVRYDVTDLDDEQAGQLALEAQAQAERSDGHPGVEVEIEWNVVEREV